MERRQFLKAAIATGAVLSVGAVGYIGLSRFHRFLFKMIREDTLMLGVSEEDIWSFIEEANNRKYWEQFSATKRLALRFQYYSGWVRHQKMEKAEQLRAMIVGQFLLSTTFFRTPEAEVVYLGFYDPFLQACNNPFAGSPTF